MKVEFNSEQISYINEMAENKGITDEEMVQEIVDYYMGVFT